MTNEDVVYARLLCFSTLPCNYLILCSMQSMALLSSLFFFFGEILLSSARLKILRSSFQRLFAA